MSNTYRNKKSGHYTVYTIVLLIALCAVITIIHNQFQKQLGSVNGDTDSQFANTQDVDRVKTEDVKASVQSPIIKKLTLLAVGDIMMHQEQLNATYNKKDDTYDFSNFFVNIKQYLKDGDIVYANLETPVAGKELKYSGYPKFNAPTEILSELKSSYFTHLSLANNHALDRGTAGLSNSIKNVEDLGIVPLGVREVGGAGGVVSSITSGATTSSSSNTSSSSLINYQITEKNGLRVGFLSYTYDTNGFTLPKSKAGMISYIKKDQIIKDISDLKKQNVDVVTVALHFGVEYARVENASQRELAQLACNNGADIILGDHPHVLQPIVYLNSSKDNRKCLVIYSLSNFISGMPNLYTDLGGILKVEITKTSASTLSGATSTLSLKPDFFGTWVKRGTNKDGSKYYTVLPLDADKITENIEITKTEQSRLETYRKFVDTKIKVGIVK